MMTGLSHTAIGLAFIGVIVLLTVLVRGGLARLRLPAVVGFILAGVAIGTALGTGHDQAGALPDTVADALHILAQIGLVALLFRVGLESDIAALRHTFGRAVWVFLANFTIAGVLGLAAVLWFTPYGPIPALFTGAALSATSVGVSTAVWRDAGALRSKTGALLVNVAELDDVAAMVVIGLLFALAPTLKAEGADGLSWAVAGEAALMLLKLAALIAACLLFAFRLRRRLSILFKRLYRPLGDTLFAFGSALIIAALADILGFSAAIGAMFAGLAFSTDPKGDRINRTFDVIYMLFMPFFFLQVGMNVDMATVAAAPALAAMMALVAVAGKLLGGGLPLWLIGDRRRGLLIGWSMVPRAEIALIVMSFGLSLGPWAMPQPLYGAMVIVSLVTCTLGPLVVGRLLDQNVDGVEEGSNALARAS